MHIILGLLGSLITTLVLINRLAEAGISLTALNPVLWKRRKDWQKRYCANPIFNLENPMEASALLLTASASIDGEVSREQKGFLLDVFENDFHQSKKEAAGLLRSSMFLLGDGRAVHNSLEQVMKPSLPHFNEEQISSTHSLLTRLCELDSSACELRNGFMIQIRQMLSKSANL